MKRNITFDTWLVRTKYLLALTVVDLDDLDVLENYFKEGLTPQSAAQKYTEMRMIK